MCRSNKLMVYSVGNRLSGCGLKISGCRWCRRRSRLRRCWVLANVRPVDSDPPIHTLPLPRGLASVGTVCLSGNYGIPDKSRITTGSKRFCGEILLPKTCQFDLAHLLFSGLPFSDFALVYGRIGRYWRGYGTWV